MFNLESSLLLISFTFARGFYTNSVAESIYMLCYIDFTRAFQNVRLLTVFMF